MMLWIIYYGHGHHSVTDYSSQEYINTDPADRDPDTPVFRVKQGYEPPTFTGHFGVWENDFFTVRFQPLYI